MNAGGMRGSGGRAADGETYGEGHVRSPQPRLAQAHGSFVEQLVGHCVCTLRSTQLRREDVGVSNGFRVLQLRVAKVLTAQPVPQFFAADATPGSVQLLPIEG